MKRALAYIEERMMEWLYQIVIALLSLLLCLIGTLTLLMVIVSFIFTDKDTMDRVIEIGIVMPVGLIFIIMSIVFYFGIRED